MGNLASESDVSNRELILRSLIRGPGDRVVEVPLKVKLISLSLDRLKGSVILWQEGCDKVAKEVLRRDRRGGGGVKGVEMDFYLALKI